MTKGPLVKRRFLQFGLRTLLVVTTAVAIWLGFYVERARRQQAAVRAIRAAGGWVHYDFQEQPPGSGTFDIQARPGLPAWLVDRIGEDFLFTVVDVNLVYSNDSGRHEDNLNVSGDTLRHVADLPKLKKLLQQPTKPDRAAKNRRSTADFCPTALRLPGFVSRS
ncbi:MAG TPA: hypothetical protein VHC22_34195 [Pirellulales bacterium]|nr:hypothetical protein [Pirellulales bacterium]